MAERADELRALRALLEGGRRAANEYRISRLGDYLSALPPGIDALLAELDATKESRCPVCGYYCPMCAASGGGSDA